MKKLPLVLILIFLFSKAPAIAANSSLLPNFSYEETVRQMSEGKVNFDSGGALRRIFRLLTGEISSNLSVMARLTALAVITGLIKNLGIAHRESSVEAAAFFAFYALLAGICAENFSQAAFAGKKAIDEMLFYMQVAVPAMGAMMVSSGSIVSAASLEPGILFAAQASAAIIKNISLPLIYTSLALTLVNNVFERGVLGHMGALFKKASIWIMGISLTVFSAFLSITGFASGAVDGVSIKTTKFAIGSMLPVAGSILSDAAEAVVGSAVIFKNASGAAAMLLILSVCALPLVKIGALSIIYRLTAAFCEPVCDKRFASALEEMAKTLGAVFSMVAGLGIMLIISLAVMVNAGGFGR